MENELTEVIQCAEWLERLTIRSSLGKISKRFALNESSLNLRRLHARVQELEGMLEAVGADGVSAQRVTQVAPQPQADARDAELVAAVVYASTEAMNSSMESPSFDGSLILESHHAASLSLALDELEQHRAAIAAAKGAQK